MKLFFLLAILLLFRTTRAQFAEGFSSAEAIEMMALNNSFTFRKVFNEDSSIIPSHYVRFYKSGMLGLDNQFQIWISEKVAVISFRGSTDDKISWLANLYSAMIPASAEMVLPGGDKVPYCLAKDTAAHVHAGWTLGLMFMVNDLSYHIQNLYKLNIHHFIFTGHSQGAAIAHLARAYFENLSPAIIPSDIYFKTYAFACPMPGNKAFAAEYRSRYAANQSSFTINNTNDIITTMPVALYNGKLLNVNELMDLFTNNEANIPKLLAIRALTKIFIKEPDLYYVNKAGYDIEKQIEKSIGEIQMPPYLSDQSYTGIENKMLIGPFEDVLAPLIADSINLDSLRKTPFYAHNLDIQTGSMNQHKPFNYYLFMLKTYQPARYELVKFRYRIID
jgi:uncharacterized protein YoaH (UPF0181 family)